MAGRGIRSALLVSLVLSWAVALTLTPAVASAQKPGERELNKQEQAIHALSRLTFGARPGDLQQVTKIGVDNWIEQQLNPASLSDSAALNALSPLRSWTLDARTLATGIQIPNPERIMTSMQEPVAAPLPSVKPLSFTSPANEFVAGKIIRAQLSERQLEEVLVDFWLNHFSVFSGKMPSVEAIVAYERDVIRPRAFGKFRDLVGAVAHSPAMLFYLDNQLSRSDSLHRSLTEFRAGTTADARTTATKKLGLNENYGRELLELHTLGVDGGYTQDDVIAVARAFTGWSTSVTRSQAGSRVIGVPALFNFVEDSHDAESKTVLGHALEAGRGVEDGEQVLDIIARHPATARFIATKLARRFVSDSPSSALIERAAATFTRTDGNITETLRTIFTSPEFFSRDAFRAKVKTPFEFVVSARRALNAPADTSTSTARAIAQLGQPTLGKETPDGWPDIGSTWLTGFALLDRINFVEDVAAGRLKFLPTIGWNGWNELDRKNLQPQVDGVIAGILGGVASDATRALMLATPRPESVAAGGAVASTRLRELLAFALASPEFQRR